MMACKGICDKIGIGADRASGAWMYRDGYRMCTTCHRGMKAEGLFCPCCGYKLRNRIRKASRFKKGIRRI